MGLSGKTQPKISGKEHQGLHPSVLDSRSSWTEIVYISSKDLNRLPLCLVECAMLAYKENTIRAAITVLFMADQSIC